MNWGWCHQTQWLFTKVKGRLSQTNKNCILHNRHILFSTEKSNGWGGGGKTIASIWGIGEVGDISPSNIKKRIQERRITWNLPLLANLNKRKTKTLLVSPRIVSVFCLALLFQTFESEEWTQVEAATLTFQCVVTFTMSYTLVKWSLHLRSPKR